MGRRPLGFSGFSGEPPGFVLGDGSDGFVGLGGSVGVGPGLGGWVGVGVGVGVGLGGTGTLIVTANVPRFDVRPLTSVTVYF
ncbi:hypothetical protein C1706_10485 [Propioniciclava flava]|uniref:Uncharacterized protein n=1 Tax=Propioniciclava flava TaxID=2072026 RepID=A0A4V1Q773_9ACTN|nr:hypothetical protein C1706_10485 [Propioniciclava flava]